MRKICIVGLGNIGGAIHDSLLKNNFEVEGFSRDEDGTQKTNDCETVILATKPQDFENFSYNIENKLVISIMAGISTSKIAKKTGAEKIIRVMPNLALKVGKSLSGWFASKAITSEEKTFIKEILNSFGTEIEVEDEKKIDAITALSGSGPAYFYLLTEIIQNAATKYGFTEKQAKQIANKTFEGAAELIGDNNATNLRQSVTSKGGTTEAALKHMAENKLEEIVTTAIEVARKRAEELNS